MKVNIVIDEEDVRALVIQELANRTNLQLTTEDVTIEVKSKQNFRSEWESANFRATINKKLDL